MVPNGWEKHPVGKICSSIVPGRNKPKQFGGNIAWVTTPEIIGKFIPSSVQENYISEETIKECGGKVVPKGAVVMAAVGDLGLIAITKEEVVLNQQLHAFVCSSKINNEFLAYWLATQTPYMESVASKTTILYLNKTNCESIPVLVPPILEQQKIAKILSTWDKAISTTERLIDNSTHQKKALMQQLLTGKKRLLDESGKRFEGEWEEVELKDIANIYQPQTISQKHLTNEGYLVYGANGIIGKYSDYNHENEQIAVTCRGSTCGVVNWTEPKSWITGNAMVINVDEFEQVSKRYLYYKLSFTNFSYLISGSGQPQITGNIKNHKAEIPSLKEQQKIATVLTNADKEIELLEQQLADLQQEKKALMQVLLTGKVRVVV